MKGLFPITFLSLALLGPTELRAEVNFPQTRNAVGIGEPYLLESFESWNVWCVRGENGEDYCHVSTPVPAIEYGFELKLDVTPYGFRKDGSNLDVDVVPEAIIKIYTVSRAEHYERFSTAIFEVGSDDFDAYWCPMTNTDDCFRGPFIQRGYLDRLLNSDRLEVTIVDSQDTPDSFKPKATIEVDLSGFSAAYARASDFNAEIWGVPLPFEPEIAMCGVSIGGIERRVSYEYNEEYDAENTTLREAALGPKGEGDCPSYVTLALLTPDMTPNQRNMFCLVLDEDLDTITGIQLGEQDAYRVCKAPSKSFCKHVNDSKEAALSIAGFVSASVGAAIGKTAITGTTVVAHSSGAAILTGTGGYVAGTLGTIGTTALGILTAPATLTAAAVSVVAVGGAVYVCSDE